MVKVSRANSIINSRGRVVYGVLSLTFTLRTVSIESSQVEVFEEGVSGSNDKALDALSQRDLKRGKEEETVDLQNEFFFFVLFFCFFCRYIFQVVIRSNSSIL